MKAIARSITLFIVGFVTISAFQNCGRMGGARFETGKIPEIGPEHPDVAPSVHDSSLPMVKMKLGDQLFLESFFKSLILSDDSSAEQNKRIKDLMDAEILPNQHHLGRPCNIYLDGSLQSCYFTESNQTNAMESALSASREATRYQICRRLTVDMDFEQRLLELLPERTSTPTIEALQQLISVFYPDLIQNENILQTLLRLDRDMAQNRESYLNRWRLIFLTLCESPYWQLI